MITMCGILLIWVVPLFYKENRYGLLDCSIQHYSVNKLDAWFE